MVARGEGDGVTACEYAGISAIEHAVPMITNDRFIAMIILLILTRNAITIAR
jgi:hypothetical protein